jgi:hypothetical protein
VATRFDGRPFSSRLEEIRRLRGYRFVDLERFAGRARSSGWFNNLLNGRSPWRVQPPSDDTIDDLAHLLETTSTHVREMIAEEWYDVGRTEQSGRVAALAPRLDALSDEDADFVEQMVQRLLKNGSAAEKHPSEKRPKPVRKIKKRSAA